MTTLYIIRHCESEANIKRILASRLDFPLSLQGKKDADEIAHNFNVRFTIDKIISSPLTRAYQTAESFAKKTNQPIEIDERLLEQELGRFAGLTYTEAEVDPHYEKDRLARWEWAPDGGGESYKMIAERVKPFLEEISKYADKKILVVTHAVTMRLLRAHIENTLPDYPEKIAHNGELWICPFNGLGGANAIESLSLVLEKNFHGE